jgi:hypothetical protein
LAIPDVQLAQGDTWDPADPLDLAAVATCEVFLALVHREVGNVPIRLVQLDDPIVLAYYAILRGDVRVRDEYGLSAIHYAAHFGRVDCARVLLTYANGDQPQSLNPMVTAIDYRYN